VRTDLERSLEVLAADLFVALDLHLGDERPLADAEDQHHPFRTGAALHLDVFEEPHRVDGAHVGIDRCGVVARAGTALDVDADRLVVDARVALDQHLRDGRGTRERRRERCAEHHQRDHDPSSHPRLPRGR